MLGFQETFRTPKDGPPGHIELRLGGLVLGLATTTVLRERHVSSSTRGRRELSLPHDFLTNLRVAWVADKDGNPVQIVCRR